MLVNTKSVHLDVLLDEVERVGKVWFKICLIHGLKVGNIIIVADLTIIICHLHLNFPLL
jgi:hypothetical protein